MTNKLMSTYSKKRSWHKKLFSSLKQEMVTETSRRKLSKKRESAISWRSRKEKSQNLRIFLVLSPCDILNRNGLWN